MCQIAKIHIPDSLQDRLINTAIEQGKNVEALVQEALEIFLNSSEVEKPKSMAEALGEARAKIDSGDTPLIHTWEELEAEIAERRGGYYN